jgi:hypothetical protein
LDSVSGAYEKGATTDDAHLEKYLAFIEKNTRAAELSKSFL